MVLFLSSTSLEVLPSWPTFEPPLHSVQGCFPEWSLSVKVTRNTKSMRTFQNAPTKPTEGCNHRWEMTEKLNSFLEPTKEQQQARIPCPVLFFPQECHDLVTKIGSHTNSFILFSLYFSVSRLSFSTCLSTLKQIQPLQIKDTKFDLSETAQNITTLNKTTLTEQCLTRHACARFVLDCSAVEVGVAWIQSTMATTKYRFQWRRQMPDFGCSAFSRTVVQNCLAKQTDLCFETCLPSTSPLSRIFFSRAVCISFCSCSHFLSLKITVESAENQRHNGQSQVCTQCQHAASKLVFFFSFFLCFVLFIFFSSSSF